MSSIAGLPVDRGGLAVLAGFRQELRSCLTGRGDELSELVDAVLCVDGPVRSLVRLALAPEHRRGHGSLYDGVNHGCVEVARLRRVLAGLPVPRAADGRIVLAVDVSPWLRPWADTCPERSFCHTYGWSADTALMIPGWPYSFVVALESGPTSWTAILDAVRLAPDADVAAVTCEQVRQVVERLVDAGHWQPGDPDVLIVTDAGYDGPRLAWCLADLPVQVLTRLRSDRVLRRRVGPPPQRPTGGRPARHGPEFLFNAPASWGDPDAGTVTDTVKYGTITAQAWGRLHPCLTRQGAWRGHTGQLPIIEGAVIRVVAERLPCGGRPKPMWLWWSGTDTDIGPADVDYCWMAYHRRFDIEHTFRLLKQTLGWTAPRLRDPEAADRWTWLVIAAHTQLRLARPLTADLRLPWERPTPPGQLTPARVRRGFRQLHALMPSLANPPKPSRPGPGRPPGVKNTHPATRHDIGRTLPAGQPRRKANPPKKGTRPRRTG